MLLQSEMFSSLLLSFFFFLFFSSVLLQLLLRSSPSHTIPFAGERMIFSLILTETHIPFSVSLCLPRTSITLKQGFISPISWIFSLTLRDTHLLSLTDFLLLLGTSLYFRGCGVECVAHFSRFPVCEVGSRQSEKRSQDCVPQNTFMHHGNLLWPQHAWSPSSFFLFSPSLISTAFLLLFNPGSSSRRKVLFLPDEAFFFLPRHEFAVYAMPYQVYASMYGH